jgi:RND superfamily putative drug exporter
VRVKRPARRAPSPAALSRVFALPARRGAKWLIAVAWIAVVVFAGSAGSRFEEAQDNDPASYAPGSAESSRAAERVKRISGGQAVTAAVVVFHRPGGLRPDDLRAVGAVRLRVNARLPRNGVPSPAPLPSADRAAVLLTFGLRVRGDDKALARHVIEIRRLARQLPPGLAVKVSGPAGSAYDAGQVFEKINGTLLAVTVALIFVLLLIIYRSPIFWFIPLLAVGFAEVTAEGLGYLLTQLGVTVNGQAAAILTVLIFGAGTDYALLLVARYREELGRRRDRHDAMRVALGRAGPVIVASAGTVITALLCLLVADVNGTRGLGPIAAMGVAVALLSALTLLPALLLIFGRGAFWPFVPRFSEEPVHEVRGAWARIADRVDRRYERIALAATAALVVMCAGVVFLDNGLTSGNSFRDRVESIEGQTLIAAHYPAGTTAPVVVVVPDATRLDAVRAAIAGAPGVARGPLAVGPPQGGPHGAFFAVTLAANPSTQRAFDLVAPLRATARRAGGAGTLVGGPTAAEVDLRAAAERDRNVIVPLILAVVFVVLALLLRALVAPALLVVTVVLSYGAALGTGAFLFKHVFGYPGEDPSLVLFTFLFLVALGVDYNIFLMARVREETLRIGTLRGVIRALATTGSVITSAGVVLAGTFAALASLPLIGFTQLGFVIAFGVLLDTFLVRTILVPAIVLELGRRVWWPSRLSRGITAQPTLPRRRPAGLSARRRRPAWLRRSSG